VGGTIALRERRLREEKVIPRGREKTALENMGRIKNSYRTRKKGGMKGGNRILHGSVKSTNKEGRGHIEQIGKGGPILSSRKTGNRGSEKGYEKKVYFRNEGGTHKKVLPPNARGDT